MGFSTFRASQRDIDRIAQLKASLHHPENPNPDQIFENLDLDPQVPDHSRRGRGSRAELLKQLTDDPDQSKVALRAYARKHGREGVRIRTARRFGKVTDLENLVHALRRYDDGYSQADLRSWLLDMIRRPAGRETLELQRKELSGLPLSAHPMWAFHCDGEVDPPGPLPLRRAEMIDRLGLADLRGRDCVVVFWCHRLPPGSAAHRPTIWDTCLESSGWRPTGRTEPLDGGGPPRGFPEVVHEPITGSELCAAIVEIHE